MGLNEVVVVTLRVRTNGVEMVGLRAFISYDREFLRVVDASGNPATQIDPIVDTLEEVFVNEVSVSEISYVAVAFVNPNPPPPENFDTARIRFRAIKCAGPQEDLPLLEFVGETAVADPESLAVTGLTIGTRVGCV